MTKTIKKTLALVLSVLMIMSVVPMGMSFAATEGNYEYSTSYASGKYHAIITKYTGTESEITIPEKLGGYDVQTIAESAFENNSNITKVIISDKVEVVRDVSFNKCSNLEEVVFGAAVKEIGSSAFRNCPKLKVVTLGESIETIGNLAFRNCDGLVVNYSGTATQWNGVEIADNTFVSNGYTVVYNYGYDCNVDGHKEATLVEEKSATCTEDGNTAYWYCGVCEATFSDEVLITPVTDVVIPAIHKTLEKTDAKEATCVTQGNAEFWYCATCNTYFADAEATTGFENNNPYYADADKHSLNDWYYVESIDQHKRYCTNVGCSYYETEDCADSATDNDCNCDACDQLVEHDFLDATCSVPKTCRVCKAIDGEVNANNHNLSKTDATPYSCTVNGNLEYWYCSLCKKYFKDAEATEEYAENEWVTAAAHSTKWVLSKEPTCTENGNIGHWVCKVCGLTFENSTATKPEEDVVVPATGHALWHFDPVAPTCTEGGNIEYWFCRTCRKYYSDEATQNEITSEERYLDPIAHDLEEHKEKKATCTAEGNKLYYACKVCEKYFDDARGTNEITNKDWVVIKKAEHVGYSVIAKAPTCTEMGNITYIGCKECKGLFTDKTLTTKIEKIEDTQIAATGHTPGEPVKENDVPMECDKDGSYDKVVYCVTCKEELSRETEVVAHGHNVTITFPLVYKTPATCTEPAYIEEFCSRCQQNVEIPVGNPLGHTETKAPDREVTCEEDGLKGGTWCSVCETYIVEPVVTPKLGHKWVEASTTATCTAAGQTTFVCENDPIHTKVEDTAALGHAYPDEWDVIEEATCTDAGVQIKDCTRCGEKTVRLKETIPALGHDFDVTIPAVTATCISGGNDAYKQCKTCNLYFAENAKTNSVDGTDNTEEFNTPIDGTNHVNAEAFEEDPATCLEGGFTSGTYCNDCERWISGHDETAPLGHDFDETVAAVAATCSLGGNNAYKQCKACELYFADEAADNAADGAESADAFNTPIDGSNHADTEIDEIGTAATCLEGGFTSGTYCNDCKVWISGHDPIPALSHKDENKDHACDNNCNVYQGTHDDTDKDHNCDYGCQEVIGNHDDADKDHDCDYGCQIEIGTHDDEDKDHACDYGCQEVIGSHDDADKDHNCDYGCQEEIGTHEDTDKDHACDYGCQEEIGVHEDADKDHDCDYGCQEVIGSHDDADNNHDCDYGCQEAIGTHADAATDDDHLCDYGCGAVLEDCVDGDDNNHNCDICDEEYISEHSYTVADCYNPATCTVCGETTGTVDEENHIADTYEEIENEVDGTCTTKATWDVVTYCDGCGEELDRETVTGSMDPDNHDWSEKVTTVSNSGEKTHSRDCTRCDEILPVDHSCSEDDFILDTPATCIATGLEKAYCSYCRGNVYRILPKTAHKDADKNNKCDVCSVTIQEKPADPAPEVPDEGEDDATVNCSCNCHAKGIMGFLYDFVLFFQRLLGLNKMCTGGCGQEHY